MGRIITPDRNIIMPSDRHGIVMLPMVRMKGLYKLRVHKAKSGTVTKETGWMDNVITNLGLGYFHTQPHFGAFDSSGATFNNVAVGSGSTTPTVNDTTLTSYVASVSAGELGGGTGWLTYNSSGYVPAASPNPPYWWARINYLFPTGVAAGNLTEIGVYPGGTSYTNGLFSHALIVDAGGNPTTITVLSDEVLTVTYQINYYIDTSDTAFSFNLNSSPVTGIYRMCNIGTTPNLNGGLDGNVPTVGFYTGAIGTVTGQPTGQIGVSQGNSNPGSFIDWVNDIANSGTWYYDYTLTMPTGTATGTIASITYNHGLLQYQFGNLSTPIVKTSGQQLQMSFRGSWGRYP